MPTQELKRDDMPVKASGRDKPYRDHESIRKKVAEAIRKSIVENGIDSVTNRKIARDLGYSTSIIQHYFSNKHEMMSYVHSYTDNLAMAHVAQALQTHEGRLKPCVTAFLPMDEERRTNWLVWIAYWGYAVADAEFSDIQRTGVQAAREIINDRIDALKAAGLIGAHIDSANAARRLMALIQGVSLQAAFDPDDWPAERQALILESECERLTGLTD
ncbi:MAG: TetR family transcriptional regulator C-terminal domain-containing protein [Sphingobium sp.]